MKKIYDFGVAPGTTEYYRLWRAANREKVRARAKRYYYADPQKQRDRTTRYRATEHGAQKTRERYERQREQGLVQAWSHKWKCKRFGLTVAEYDAMLIAQDHKCAICRADNPRCAGRKRFFVDHCHATNKVRGLLCTHCNAALGHFSDSPDLLSVAIAYLQRHG